MKLGLVAIVKDEAASVERCLASARPHISHWTIVDTGSTDGTPELVERALEGIPGTLHRRPWVSFGHNRSEAFALAHGTADWLLALDADMTLELDEDFDPDPTVDAYMLAMGDAEFTWRLPLLLRGSLPWQSVGAVHEYTTLPWGLGNRVATDAVRVVTGGVGATPEKLRWHASLLEAELERRPDDARTVFYLAQTYRDLHDARAIGLYQRRAEMGGWDEEVFYARYRGALMLPGWPAQMGALLDTWESRPHRLEPLHALLRGFNNGSRHQAAYRLSDVPLTPTNDVLFIHRSVWDWGITFERSIAAWWVGEREESRSLGEQLLAQPRLPANIRAAVERNLAFGDRRAA